MNNETTNTITISIEATIEPKDTLVFRQGIGTAEDPESGNKYEMSLCNMMMPCIRSEKTGKWFVINWQALVKAAVSSGIDEEDLQA